MPPPRRRSAQTPRQRTPTREGPSFFDTMAKVGQQRAAQPPRTPAVRPTQEGPSFAQTMGQGGQQRWEETLGRTADRITYNPDLNRSGQWISGMGAFERLGDAPTAGGFGLRNPGHPGVALAQSLGLNQISPAGQANMAMNAAQNYPGAPPVSVPTSAPGSLMADPGSVSFPPRVSPTGNINPNAASLSVAPMLDVFRKDPAAMSALISGQGGYPGYNPQFTGLQQNAYPWERWNPVFGGMATTQHGPTNLGSWYGKGTWDPIWEQGGGNPSPTGAPPWYQLARSYHQAETPFDWFQQLQGLR